MKPRVLIFDEDKALSSTLKKILDDQGYEVFTFSKRGLCPLFLYYDHKPIYENACSDIIISDLYLPTIRRLRTIKDRIDKGCAVKFRALMSTIWSDSAWQYASKLGCRLFRKPFDLKEMLLWIDNCGQMVYSERKLLNFDIVRKR